MSQFPNTQEVRVWNREIGNEKDINNVRLALTSASIPLREAILTERFFLSPSVELCLSDSGAISQTLSSDSQSSSCVSFEDYLRDTNRRLSFERNTTLECSAIQFMEPWSAKKQANSTVPEFSLRPDSDDNVSSSMVRAWMSVKLFKASNSRKSSGSSSKKITPQLRAEEEKCIGRKCHMSSHSLDTEANGAVNGPTRTFSNKLFSQSKKRRASTPNLRQNESIMSRALVKLPFLGMPAR